VSRDLEKKLVTCKIANTAISTIYYICIPPMLNTPVNLCLSYRRFGCQWLETSGPRDLWHQTW